MEYFPPQHWLLLYRWYGNLKGMVKWNNNYSSCFRITKGTRQGGLLSPQLFNIFINDLLKELKDSPHKVCIGSCSFNSFAYADDITIMCTTVSGLQNLIDKCVHYSKKWRFRFGINKTKCMIVSGDRLCKTPEWYLDNCLIENVKSLEILGVQFDQCNTEHVDKRSDKCRRSFYGLRDIGMAFPGCDANVKTYMWNTICQPTLLYGFDAICVSASSVKKLKSVQSSLIKQSLGLSKRSKSTNMLHAMGITKVEDKIKLSTASLFKRIFAIESPVKQLSSHFLSMYITHGKLYPGTIVERLVSYGLSPTMCAFNKFYLPTEPGCGVVDSLRHLLMHQNFIKPYSEEHLLTSLLTSAF